MGGLRVEPSALLGVVAGAVAIHASMLALNLGAARLLRLRGDGGPEGRGVERAVVICASQKTLPVSVAILQQLSGSLGAGVGLAVIPCVASHMLQV